MRPTLAPDDPRHGTYNGYHNLGCRCLPCTLASTDAQRRIRDRRQRNAWVLLNNPDHPGHGTYNFYTNYKCRCLRCVEAGRIYKSDYNRRQREAVSP